MYWYTAIINKEIILNTIVSKKSVHFPTLDYESL